MFAGRVSTGPVVSCTVTVKLPPAELLASSLAVQVTVAVPKPKVLPEAGLQLTVYSTEARQIGVDASANRGIAGALQGRIVSELVHRDSFNALDGIVEKADVLQSYVPIRNGGNGSIEAVFEVYDNVTPFLARIGRTQTLVTGGVALVFARRPA